MLVPSLGVVLHLLISGVFAWNIPDVKTEVSDDQVSITCASSLQDLTRLPTIKEDKRVLGINQCPSRHKISKILSQMKISNLKSVKYESLFFVRTNLFFGLNDIEDLEFICRRCTFDQGWQPCYSSSQGINFGNLKKLKKFELTIILNKDKCHFPNQGKYKYPI